MFCTLLHLVLHLIGSPAPAEAGKPWVGDLDQDQQIDIIFCHGTNLRHTYTFDGMQVRRLATSFPMRKPVRWGSYQGSHYDGNFYQER